MRRLSPKDVLGGGRIEAAGTSSGIAAQDGGSAHASAVLAALRKPELTVMTAADLARDANLREDAAAAALDELFERGLVMRVSRPPAWVDAQSANDVLARTVAALQQAQLLEPWSMGATSLALSRTLAIGEALLLRVLTEFADEGRLAHRAGYFATTDHTPKLTEQQQSFFDEILPREPADSLLPAPLETVVAHVKQSRVPGISKAFDTLVAKGALVKVNDDIYRGTQIAAIRARVERFLRANRQMTMAQFRDLIGTSRKYAVPLLEWFDARGITVRSGDYRMLRSTSS